MNELAPGVAWLVPAETRPHRRQDNAGMTTLSAISLSGMSAAQTALETSAHNVANLAMDGFRRRQVTQSTAADGGVTTSLTQATQPGDDLAGDLVGQLVAKNQFLANLAVFKTGDQMMGTLLDATS
ncbi:MAG: flagellar basal body protein [Proteobacteria bacterium]|nr:flagellar basal body protein [Pseudomonadota bacterium]